MNTASKFRSSPAPVVAPAEPALSVESVQTSPEGVACVPAPTLLTKDQQFFYENAGYCHDPKTQTEDEGHRECAYNLASAEAWARNEGVTFHWAQDTVAGEWACIAYDAQDGILGSLGGVDFGKDVEPWGQPYKRVVEAEIVLEAMPDVPAPSPAEPAKSPATTEAVHTAAPSVRYYASGLMGSEGNYTIDIMRVTENDGNRTDGLYACLECTRLPFELQKEADRLVEVLNGGAAHLAKIQALTEALNDSHTRFAMILELGKDRFASIREHAERGEEAARAALALPTAPQGS